MAVYNCDSPVVPQQSFDERPTNVPAVRKTKERKKTAGFDGTDRNSAIVSMVALAITSTRWMQH